MANSLPYIVTSAERTGETWTGKGGEMHVWAVELEDANARKQIAHVNAKPQTDWAAQIGQRVQGDLYFNRKRDRYEFKREYQEAPQQRTDVPADTQGLQTAGPSEVGGPPQNQREARIERMAAHKTAAHILAVWSSRELEAGALRPSQLLDTHRQITDALVDDLP